MQKAVFSLCIIGLAGWLAASCAWSQQMQPVQSVPLQTDAAQTQGQAVDSNDAQALQLTAVDRQVAQLWGISDEEMMRAKLLKLGPRGAFSVPGISPLEILGIHARNDAERRKYAELFARMEYADVQRVLAFQRAYDVEIGKLTAGQPMIDFRGLPKVSGTTGAADMMHVPHSLLIDGGQGGAQAAPEGQP